MIQEDYIVRMMERLFKFIKNLLKKKGESREAAMAAIDSALREWMGLDYNLLKSLSAESILSLFDIAKEPATCSTKCIVVGKLLKERAELEVGDSQQGSDQVGDFQKVLFLLLEGILTAKSRHLNPSDYFVDISDMANRIKDAMPEKIRLRLIKFYELLGEHAQAKKALAKLEAQTVTNTT